jgi:2-phospho-L-lactate guanylyltransferase
MKEKVLAIIPVRESRNSKLRLRGFLSTDERSFLSKALFEHVLKAVQNSVVSKILVVASDAKEVKAAVHCQTNISVIGETNPHGGVNSAALDGISYCLATMKQITSVMVLPSDLPLLTSDAIGKAISRLARYDLIIGPSSKLDGTNLLLFNLKRGKIPFHYDNDSYKNHVKEAKRLKIRYMAIKPREFSWDVDTEEDLRKLMSKFKTRSFAELLLKIRV